MGHGYNTTTGVYTVPETGSYDIDVYIVKRHEKTPTFESKEGPCAVDMKVDGKVVSFSNTQHLTIRDDAYTYECILYNYALTKGQKLWLVHVNDETEYEYAHLYVDEA